MSEKSSLSGASLSGGVSRRHWLQGAAAAGALGGAALFGNRAQGEEKPEIPPEDYKIEKGRAKQSVMAWCFDPLPMEKLIPACAKMGLSAMEGLDPKYYPLMKEHGLGVSLCSGHGFAQGPVNPEYQEMCRKSLREAIDRAVKWDCKNVITFTGMSVKGMTQEQGTKNSVDFFKTIVGYA